MGGRTDAQTVRDALPVDDGIRAATNRRAQQALDRLEARLVAIDNEDSGYAWICDLCGQLLAQGEKCNSGYHSGPNNEPRGSSVRSDVLVARLVAVEDALRQIVTPYPGQKSRGYDYVVGIARAALAAVDTGQGTAEAESDDLDAAYRAQESADDEE